MHGETPKTRIARALPVAALALVVLLTACDALDRALSVEAPGVIDADDITEPENADLLVTGAIADFECALGAYIVNQAILGNELRDASVTAARFSLDQRTIDASSPYAVNSCAGNPPGIYVPLATAIWSSNDALRLLDGWTDAEVEDRDELIARAATYSGYGHTLMGEGFCTAVIEPEGGEIQPDAVFEVAEARFTRAIGLTADDDLLDLAQLGRARVRRNLDDPAGAADDARAVLERDPLFEANASTSTADARRWNRIGDEFFGGRVTVDPSYRGLTVDGQPDPRVETIATGTDGHDSETEVVLAAKVGVERDANALRTRPVPIASWREARLIIAEAEGGQSAVEQINALRDHWELPRFESTDDDEIRAQIVEERSRELYLEGHHLFDLRRFDLPHSPAPGADYRQGGIYGSVACFPLPDVERDNNSSLTGS